MYIYISDINLRQSIQNWVLMQRFVSHIYKLCVMLGDTVTLKLTARN